MPTDALPPLLSQVMPEFARELDTLMLAHGRSELAAQVPTLRIVDRCRCGDDFCGTFYTEPRPKTSYGAGHSNVEPTTNQGIIILDVVSGRVACVEVLYRDEIRDQIHALLP
jgi:hypothetical protein